MKKIMAICFTMFVAILFSCNEKTDNEISLFQEGEKRVYADDFEDGIQPFWRVNQLVDPSRLLIVKDPLNEDNKVAKVSIKRGDRIAGGYRNEIIIDSKDSLGYLNKFSYKFMFPKSFFEKEDKRGIIVLTQWHDEPYPGFTWTTKKIKVKPPMAMYVEHTPNGRFEMVLHSGVRMGNVDELKLVRWKESLEPDVWYTFSCEIFWSIYEDGYVKASINDKCFEYQGKEQCTYQATNMYHKIPNYYKMGLYWSGTEEHDRHIYYDDFKMTTQQIGYFPPK